MVRREEGKNFPKDVDDGAGVNGARGSIGKWKIG